MKTQWYVLYFKAHSERRAADVLTRKKIENYFPVSKVVDNSGKVADQPLFDSYLFVHTSEKQLETIKKLPTVINLVYWLGKPVVVSDAEISTLKRFLTDHVNIKVEKITLGTGLVKKISSPLIEEDESSFKIINQNIHIVLPSLGYKVTAEAETSNVRIISSNTLIDKSRLRTSKLFNRVQFLNNF